MTELVIESVVERIAFDYGVDLLLTDGSVIRVESEGAVIDEGVVAAQFDAESLSTAVPAIVQLLHRTVQVLVDRAALLVIDGQSGVVLRVEPSIDYEAWSVVRADGSRWVCAPSGEIVRWPSS